MRLRLSSGWNIVFSLAAATTASSSSSSSPFRALAFHNSSPRTRFRSFASTHPPILSSMSSSSTEDASATISLRFVDIGANLMDERYTDGIYFGKKRHEADFDLVLERAVEQGVTHLILTAGTLRESQKAVGVVEDYRKKWDESGKPPPIYLGCTVGVHPTRCQQEFVDNLAEDQTPEDVLETLRGLLSKGSDNGSVVAIGEFGLDYDRLEFAPKDIQNEFFRRQLDTFGDIPLPLFLHNRSVGKDLLDVLLDHQQQRSEPIRGVVHSFDDSLELATAFIDLGLYIGLNGCSLKTENNLAVVKELPLDKILLETDCPYCEIKATHAGHHFVQTTFAKKPDKKFVAGTMVKGRNEPNQIVQVAEVIAGVKGISVRAVAATCYQNSMDLYNGFASSRNSTNPGRL